jgi:membrane associated rhomboid family serine protease
MIPIRDQLPTRRTPVVNYLLILMNVIVFFFMWLAGPAQETIVMKYAMIPANFANGVSAGDILDIFSSMFMHAGFAHIAGNMLYLWIFGDNVEDRLGSRNYLIFYLVGGFIASITHVLTNSTSTIPTVGASGAIAAVLGAYLVLYPKSRILTFIPLGFFLRLTLVPASLVLGFWFVMQLFSGFLSTGGPDVGGVAFWAHVGGFVAGVIMALPAAAKKQTGQVSSW